MIYYIVALLVLLLDQVTKWLVVAHMNLYESIPVIGDFFQIYSHRNKGAAFGILQNQRVFFIVVTVVVVVGIIVYLQRVMKQRKVLLPVSLAVLLGGALGNFIDRVRSGEVVDFFKFHFQFPFFGAHVDYVFPVFNVADMAIVISVGMIFLDALLDWRKEKKELTTNEASQ